jgi:Ca2+-binding RTX toxin-like protein
MLNPDETLKGYALNNWLAGSLGADKLCGGARDDVLLIDSQHTVVDRGEGLDIAQVVGREGVTLNLSQSNMEIAVGGAGNDLIRGHKDQDQLLGGAGDDVLDGGLEDDSNNYYQNSSCLRPHLLGHSAKRLSKDAKHYSKRRRKSEKICHVSKAVYLGHSHRFFNIINNLNQRTSA